MKKLAFDYYMQIDYTHEVSKCNYTIKCIPQNNNRQHIDNYTIDMFPPTGYSVGKDGLANTQIYGANDKGHTTFIFHICGRAVTGLAEYEEEEDDSRTMIFRHPHGLNVAGESIKAYYRQLEKEIVYAESAYMRAICMMHRLYADFCYKPGTTDITTSAEQAFAQGCGVCQDYAHIFIALMHLAGIPARYVTGLIIGEGASHAWVEILCDGKWYGLDPTNDTAVYDSHIKIGIGRDAGDCMINRGINHGGGNQTQKINVNVREE